MSDEIFSRNKLIWGENIQEKLKLSNILVVGLGGVGGFAAESLARAGVGNMTIIDFDSVSKSNINRQIIALNSNVGQKKISLFHSRLLDINPDLNLDSYDTFYSKELNDKLFKVNFDFVIDAIDTMRSKIDLISYCYNNKIPIISSLGAGNRLDPTKLRICDISDIKVFNCSFLKNTIRNLHNIGIKNNLTVVVSEEKPKKIKGIKNQINIQNTSQSLQNLTKISPGSTPFVPAVSGYFLAYHVVQFLINKSN